MKNLFCLILIVSACASFLFPQPVRAANTTYYVSTSGNDANNGLSTGTPFKTIAKVNSLNLQQGDQVLFKCGDVWRGEMLMITKSGAAGNPITFGSYPDSACANKPILSGTQPIGSWAVYSGNIYVATVSSATFPNGLNQLFRNGSRLTLGRWPNLDNGDGGYTTVSAQPASNRLTSGTALPAGNWVGATIHLKVIRWSMVNRDITAQSGSTITLSDNVTCPYTTNCTSWGFFINNSLNTLDREGEWYYDKTNRKVYLYTTTNPNGSTIEGSVVLKTDDRNWGVINLGTDLDLQVHDVVIDNFEIRGGFRSGIVSPTNLHPDENSSITIRNNTIRDVDDSGINLWSWVWGASDGKDGWRGGNNILIQNNVIDGANSFGIHTPSRLTTIEGNTIRNIGLIANLNEAGMGCGKDGNEGTCTEDGAGLRIYLDSGSPDRSGYGFTVQYNRFENIGAGGIQTFGYSSTFANNFFNRICISKGDCGAINTFGSSVHDIQILSNIITDTIGNTDGTHPDFRTLFGFGLYIDENSANVTSSGNTVAHSTGHGILYQNSTGNIQNNTLFDNATAFNAAQIDITGNSSVPNHSGNILLGKLSNARTLAAGSAGLLGTSDYNGFYHANRSAHISISGDKTLAQWRSASGKDIHSTEMIASILAQAELFYNETRTAKTFTLNKPYKDFSGNSVIGSLTLQPYTSKILYPDLTPIPRLAIQAHAQAWAVSGAPITITLTAGNSGVVTATNTVITNTLPINAFYVSGGTLNNRVISWNVGNLAPNGSTQVNFVITATTTVVGNDYRVSASGGYSAIGNWIAVIIDPRQVYLPLVKK
ncbi:MAG TPA: hypothetical protein VMP08_00970 [Anaerolineae bacterium]|nr:hypothetical protein [Anaerolineae bacterium]